MKAVLVIDMPRNCWGCPCNEVDSDGMSWCNALVKNTIHSNVERQPWCPLRLLPHSKQMENRWFSDDYSKGWNDCLEEIKK